MNFKNMKIGESIVVASTLKGKILWVSERDGNGIIKDASGNEYYIDSSTVKDFKSLKRNDEVSFEPKRLKPDNILVAREVVRADADTYARLSWEPLTMYETNLKMALRDLEKVFVILRKDDSYTSEIEKLLNSVQKDAESVSSQLSNILKMFSTHRHEWKR